ncbi:MAG TPA: hypothetical protein VMU65_10155, partial [Candidatus Saccharimonadales bacterium]|nr:hypothetical protein [Candidatus Saccharimonadales bacterium]
MPEAPVVAAPVPPECVPPVAPEEPDGFDVGAGAAVGFGVGVGVEVGVGAGVPLPPLLIPPP